MILYTFRCSANPAFADTTLPVGDPVCQCTDEHRIGRFTRFIQEIMPPQIAVSPLPCLLDSAANGPLYLDARCAVRLTHIRVQRLGHLLAGIPDLCQNCIPEITISPKIGGDSQGQEQIGNHRSVIGLRQMRCFHPFCQVQQMARCSLHITGFHHHI